MPSTSTGTVTVLLPSGRLDAAMPATRPSDIGTLAHAVIAVLAPTAEAMSPTRGTESCLTLAANLAAPTRTAQAGSVQAAGYANEYLQTVLPRSPWQLLGVEFDTGDGRVDLAFQNSEGSVFFDELKTTSSARVTLDDAWLEQARRYSAAGQRMFGDRFVGTRLIPLGSRHLTSLVIPDGRVARYAPTLEAPLPVEVA